MNPKAIDELFCFAVSAKRYALCKVHDGKPVIRKVSSHGLGHLLEPYGEKDPAKHIPSAKVDLKDAHLWHHDFWHQIITAEFEGHGVQVNLAWHEALNTPAISRYRASSPSLLAWFKAFNLGKDYRNAVKPFNFLLAQISGSEALKDKVRAVAPYDKDHGRAIHKAFDRVTGKKINHKHLQSYAQSLMQYHLHPEAKFHGGDFVDQGKASCRHVKAIGIRYIGKEADRLEERYFGVLDAAGILYGSNVNDQNQHIVEFRRRGSGVTIVEISRKTNISTKHISNIVRGINSGSEKANLEILRAIVQNKVT